jgi:hypothetical protein
MVDTSPAAGSTATGAASTGVESVVDSGEKPTKKKKSGIEGLNKAWHIRMFKTGVSNTSNPN